MLYFTLEQWAALAAIVVIPSAVAWGVISLSTWAFDTDWRRRGARLRADLERIDREFPDVSAEDEPGLPLPPRRQGIARIMAEG